MNEDQGFSSLFKVIIITVLLVLVLATVLIYSKSLDGQPLKEENISSRQVPDKKVIVNQDELVKSYQEGLIGVLGDFDGDYQNLQEEILKIAVPSGFQELHLKLVLALNPVIYEDSPGVSKERLQGIADTNDWLANDLNKVILTIE